jgi:uncharacterized protein YndB with AHSA1/START domain
MAKSKFIAESGKQEIIGTTVFDAPRELVFKTYTDPNLLPQWWGLKSLKTTVEKMDLKPGGIWRFVQRDADGNEFAFHGVYHEIRWPERVVFTFEFEGMPGHISLETVTFEDFDDKTTKLTAKSVFQSVEDRDGIINSGSEEGATESMDRLAELLEKIQNKE